MTRLRQMMLDELERRNYSQTTRRAYLLGVEQFAKHFHRSPDKLKLTDIRDYQALRIPMKWGTDSGASGAASSQATLVTAIITEVPHFSQDFCAW